MLYVPSLVLTFLWWLLIFSYSFSFSFLGHAVSRGKTVIGQRPALLVGEPAHAAVEVVGTSEVQQSERIVSHGINLSPSKPPDQA